MKQYEKVEGGNNIDVYVIAACRAKQTAAEGVFSQALKNILENWSVNDLQDGYINLSKLCKKITQEINSTDQNVKYSIPGSETSPHFFPYLPKSLQTWEDKRSESVEKLLCLLKRKLENSLYFVNSFLFIGSFIEEFIGNLFEEFASDELGLRENLKEFAIKPVSQEICPLIACSEWCRCRFWDRGDISLANEIEKWQEEVIPYRAGVNLNKIKRVVRQSYNDFQERIQKEDLRIQIKIAPQKDKNGTGLNTGTFRLDMDLWVQTNDDPLFPIVKDRLLQPHKSDREDSENTSNSLRIYLEQNDFLPNLIHQARFSILVPIKLKIEFFLPRDLYQGSWEKICCQFRSEKKPLGELYPIFINSYERYYERDFEFRIIRDEIEVKKKTLWENDSSLDSEFCYIGSEPPSDSDLKMIEEALPIAVWSRNGSKPLIEGNDLKMSEWQDWPDQIHDLRKRKKDMEVTLFWDDLYPKPKRPPLFNLNLVE